MTRFASTTRIVLGFLLIAVIATAAVRITAGETPKKLRVIYTGDMIGNWEPCG